jgi:hypothetical protein
MCGKNDGHSAQLLLADEFQRAKNIAFVFDEKLRVGRYAKETFCQRIFLNPTANPGTIQFLPDLLHLRPIVGRKQHLHIYLCACFTVVLQS